MNRRDLRIGKGDSVKVFKSILSVLLVLLLVFPMMPVRAEENASETANMRSVQNSIIIDDDPTGGYEGDYVVIYNPATSSSTSYSTGTMTGLIETSVSPNIMPDPSGNQKQDTELRDIITNTRSFPMSS